MVATSLEFQQAMFGIYRSAKVEAGYTATVFFNMLNSRGALPTAKYLLNTPSVSAGYTALYERGRLDLTVEGLIIKHPQFHHLFSSKELDTARRRLQQYGYLLQTG